MSATRRVSLPLIAVLVIAALSLTLAVPPARGADEEAPLLVPNPYIDLNITRYERIEVVPQETRFYFTADVTATVPAARDCTAGGCRLTVDFYCLTGSSSLRSISAGRRSVDFAGSTFAYSYEYYMGWQNPGCGRPVVSHVVSIVISGPGSSWHEQERYLLDYDNFPLTSFLRAVEGLVGDGTSLVEQCANLDESLVHVCVNAVFNPHESTASKVHKLVAAVLLAGGTTEDLITFLSPGYVDPIPPAPAGHEVVEGYDIDEIAAAIEAAGGMELMAVLANAVPTRNSNGGTTNDASEVVITAHTAGLTVRQTLQALVNTFGAGVLIYFAFGVVPDGPGKQGQSPPDKRPVPKPNPGHMDLGGTPVMNAGDSTVNEVLRSWYRRIDDGRLGTSQVAAEVEQLLPEERLRQVARQCIEDVSNAARAGVVFDSPNPCRDMRILVPAGDGSGHFLDAYEAAKHDRDAITMRYEWVQLNYMSADAKISQVPDAWYRANPYFAVSGCKQKSASQACDEYPYYSSVQGGPSAYGGDGASLRPISGTQNTAEGIVYAAMVNTSKCAMESAAPVDRGTRAVGGTPFLVVPMPGVPIPSFFLC